MTGPSEIPPDGRALEDIERDALLEDIQSIVDSSHLFKTLDPEGRRELIESGYVVRVPAGETLMRQGEPGGDAMYLILSGSVNVEASKGAKGSVKLAILGRGACLGEVSVLGGGPRTATITALEDVQAVAFERHRIMRIIDRYPKVRSILEAMIEGRARSTVEKLIGS